MEEQWIGFLIFSLTLDTMQNRLRINNRNSVEEKNRVKDFGEKERPKKKQSNKQQFCGLESQSKWLRK